jgi:hypothetical protein
MIRLQTESKPPPQPFIGVVYRGLCLFKTENPYNPYINGPNAFNRSFSRLLASESTCSLSSVIPSTLQKLRLHTKSNQISQSEKR